MFWMPWRTHCLTDPDDRACAERTRLRHFASFAAIATSSSDIGVFLRPHAGDLLAGEIELDGIDAVLDELADGATNFLRPRDDNAEIETFVRDMRRCRVAKSADGGDFWTSRKIARSGKASFIDEALGDDVKPRLGSGGAAPSRESGVEHQFRHLHGDEHVLLELHHLDGIDAWRVVPGQMQVRIDHARHQGRAHAVDDSSPRRHSGATTTGRDAKSLW